MNVSYRREMKHNYMIIDPEEITWRSYECQMLEGNAIEGLLRFQVRRNNGELQFYYEITSRQPLARLLENRTIAAEEIRRLVIGISNVLDQIERFLLREGSILLKPEYIYVEPETFRIWLCLVPGLNLDFPKAYGDLLEYILGKVNHQDKDSVVLAYGLYQETRKENYGIEDILRLLQQTSKAEDKGRGTEREELWGRETVESGYKERTETETTWRTEASRENRENRENLEHPRRQMREPKETLWMRVKAWWKEHVREERRTKKEAAATELPWQAMFMEETPSPVVPTPHMSTPPSLPPSLPSSLPPSLPPTPSDIIPTGQGTVLLSDFSPKETVRKLRALDSGEEDILISYYPFVIGKQENLADYILNRETVSRLHLKIDRVEEAYQVMDLNSTNGTMVRGVLLENNESVVLHPGDEVQIARYRYQFV